MLPYVVKLLRLLLVIPATNAAREKAFFVMKKIRTYLHNFIKNNLLNHVMVVYVHVAHEINREFLGNNQTWLRMFWVNFEFSIITMESSYVALEGRSGKR